MNGLIRNNFYAVKSTLLCLLSIFLVTWAGILILTLLYNYKSGNISSVTFAVMGSFAGLPYTMLCANHLCAWNRFELTTPISKAAVIKARYISFALFALFALITTLTLQLTFYTTAYGVLTQERIGYTLTMIFVLHILAPGILHPLILIMGIDKAMIAFLISIAGSLGFFAISPVLITPLLSGIFATQFVYRLLVIAICILLFIVSYFISLHLYEQKDL
ncbi:MAG: ABC-2 transporter permease [Lachnospiraceae bacterium]